MKAIFLDRATFSPEIDLPAPEGVSEWKVYERTDPAEVIERLQDADIAITNKVVLDAYILGQLPNLKLVQVAATGTNNVDKDAAKQHNTEVKNVAGYSVESVAEHTFMMMLAAMRGLKSYHGAVEDGTWQKDGRFCLTEPAVLDIHSKTLAIVGMGGIGAEIDVRARAFGMHVIWAERQGKAPRDARYTKFEDALAQADIICLHCPLTDDTRHLINSETIALMQKKPLIVNAARGPVIDPQAIADAVQNEKILGIATDVFEHEPPAANDPLLAIAGHPRVIYTPHIAWASQNAQRRLWNILSQQISAYISEHA